MSSSLLLHSHSEWDAAIYPLCRPRGVRVAGRVAPAGVTIVTADCIPMSISVNRASHTVRAQMGRATRLTLVLALLLTLVRSDAIPPLDYFQQRLQMVTAGHEFNLVAWELHSLADKGKQILAGQAHALSSSEQGVQVRAFFTRAQRIQDLEGDLQRTYSATPRDQAAKEAQPLQAELDALRQQQAAEQAMVEAILEHQVGETLIDEGFSLGPLLWPPTPFRLTDPPTILIVSPRQEIARKAEAQLLPRLPLAERERLESIIDRTFDVSSLVDDLGGMSAFPTMVLLRPSIADTLDTIAHEWTHHYLFFTPLGWHYADSGDLTTMNETVASIVGQEVARQVLLRHYPDLAPPPPAPPPEVAPPPPDEGTDFDFNRVMRQTRLEVNRLLAEGQVDEAEAYMESQRRLLVEHGHHLRKLNQAYFAFHGAYATSPASVDPIGPQLWRLRAASPSLKAFLGYVSRMRSYADLQQALRILGQD